MNKQYKTAFTLAEMLITLIIIGVLMAVAVSVMRPQDMGRRAQVASALSYFDSALYNAYANDSGEDMSIQPFNSENTTGSAKYLCKYLTSYLNTTTNNCSSAAAISLSDAADATNFKKNSDTRNKYLQFTTTSGIDVFLTDRFPYPYSDTKPPFYIIFVDVNGSKGPNTTLFQKGSGLKSARYPDIYPFAAIALGRVIPMGLLENDPKLLTAKMTYMRTVRTEANAKYDSVEAVSTTYTNAKSQAWGFYTTDFQTKFNKMVDYTKSPEDNEMAEEPYAYNDYIRTTIGNSMQDYLKVPNITNMTNSITFNCPDLSETAKNTNKSFYDGSCSIEVDSYTF